MTTRPVDPDAVKALYQQWVESGRPPIRAFAKQLGRDETTVRRWLTRYAAELGLAAEDQRAALHGFAPDHDMTQLVPAPFVVKGVSTYYNKEGSRAGQWVKTQLDAEAAAAAMNAALDLKRLDTGYQVDLEVDYLVSYEEP